MDYEKKYKKKLDDARYWHDVSEGDIPAVLKEIFPELKESEDERVRKEILEYFQQFENEELRGVNISDWIAWLEKQDGRKPAEWSEEDEKMYRGLMAVCDVWSTASSFYPKENEDVERLKNWLKSLKTRITWKPSDEQIVVLELASKYERVFTPKQTDILIGLKEQLKKLKG